MLRYFLVLVVVLSASSAQQQVLRHPRQQEGIQQAQKYPVIPITNYMIIRDESGQFSLQHTDALGSSHSQRAVLKETADGKGLVLVQEGTYQYVSPEGAFIKTSYTADERGYRPTGAHIPVAPEAPAVPQVQRH